MSFHFDFGVTPDPKYPPGGGKLVVKMQPRTLCGSSKTAHFWACGGQLKGPGNRENTDHSTRDNSNIILSNLCITNYW